MKCTFSRRSWGDLYAFGRTVEKWKKGVSDKLSNLRIVN